MAHSDEPWRRRLNEQFLCSAQEWADAVLRELNGADRPLALSSTHFPSARMAVIRIKSYSVERLARLRAGVPLRDVFSQDSGPFS